MDYTDKTMTLENDKKFLVIEQVDHKDHTYLYLVNDENKADTMFVEVKDDGIFKIDPDLFETEIFPKFVEKFKEGE